MQKIPTLFLRDPDDRKHLLNKVTAGCEWVLEGEGIATRKFDGTCCLVRAGVLYKRLEIKPGKMAPAEFEAAETDDVTGKTVGWVPVGNGPEDQWHREAYGRWPPRDGTYELCGPKIQGNPEGFKDHALIRHGISDFTDVPLGYDDLSRWLLSHPYEGIVWHHPDGRMAKIKKRDFA